MDVKIDSALIEKVANNARLNLTEEEKRALAKDMKEILGVFSVLDELDVKDTKPSFQPLEIKNRWREDTKEPCLSNEEALSNTNHKKNGYFKGPKVI